MIDPFTLLAPLYLLGVIALLGFVGCAQILGIPEETHVWVPEPPTNLVASPGDGHVQLSWQTHPWVNEYHLLRAETSGSVAADYPVQRTVHLNQVPYTDSVVNGRTYFYRVTAVSEGGESDPSEEASATPAWPFGAFVTSFVPGAIRAGMNGFYGMAIEVGPVALTIQTLGRAFALGLAGVHELRLIDGATKLELGYASVDMNSPADGPFKYAPLVPGDVTVAAGGIYYIVSEEFTGGEAFYNENTIVETRLEAKVTSAVSSDSPGLYVTAGGSNQAYGPVSFQY